MNVLRRYLYYTDNWPSNDTFVISMWYFKCDFHSKYDFGEKHENVVQLFRVDVHENDHRHQIRHTRKGHS